MASPARTAPSLPVSGVRVQLREPTGEDELLAVSEGDRRKPTAAGTRVPMVQPPAAPDADAPAAARPRGAPAR